MRSRWKKKTNGNNEKRRTKIHNSVNLNYCERQSISAGRPVAGDVWALSKCWLLPFSFASHSSAFSYTHHTADNISSGITKFVIKLYFLNIIAMSQQHHMGKWVCLNQFCVYHSRRYCWMSVWCGNFFNLKLKKSHELKSCRPGGMGRSQRSEILCDPVCYCTRSQKMGLSFCIKINLLYQHCERILKLLMHRH